MTERRGLRAPFPWFGGKSLAAPLIWQAFGKVPNYVEPFAGSMAVLLARPHAAKVETVNDKDGLISNFWRAIRAAPAEVAEHCDWPVNEADLHARHLWLIDKALPLTEKLIADPEYYDAKVAGWWVWGLCAWIGNGWCHADLRHSILNPEARAGTIGGRGFLGGRRPELATANGRGVHALHRSLPAIGAPSVGIHAPSRKRPRLDTPKGVNARSISVAEVFEHLADRLRGVRVCCGDWTRVLGRSTLGIDTAHGMTPCAVLLDPPYAKDRTKKLYREDSLDTSAEVRAWALANGSNPSLRIALCGFEGEHEMPDSWRCVAWASTSSSKSRAKERIWFSPYCLPVTRQGELFGAEGEYSTEAST